MAKSVTAAKVLAQLVDKIGADTILSMLTGGKVSPETIDKVASITGKNTKDVVGKEFDIKDYSPSTLQTVINDYVLPGAATAAKATGNVLGSRDSILGAALQSIHNANPIDNAIYGDANFNTKMAGAGKLAKGAGEKIIGDATGGYLQGVADANKQRIQMNNMLKYQAREHAPGLFYQAQTGMAKAIPTYHKE